MVILVIVGWGVSGEISTRGISLDLTLNIVSGNNLVPSGNKPLPKLMLAQIYVAIWRHSDRMI